MAADELARVQELLARAPGDRELIAIAAQAAQAAGEEEVAAGYRALLAALAPPADVERTPVALPQPGRETRGAADAAGELDEVERPTVTLADVAGLEEVKRRLELGFLAPARDERLREAYGASLTGGMLLYGPPGCGKTFLARALAGELGAHFINVGIADVLDMWLGESEARLHDLFATARRLAPCVLFLDEIDALGRKRSHLRHSAGANVVSQLLNELDGAGSDREGVYVLAATNHPWDVDVALRRPGRLDRTVLVLPPDAPARAAILELHLRGRPLAGDLDLATIAARTDTFSGADLRAVCETATQSAMERSIASGDVEPVRQDDLVRAAGDVRPSTHPWFSIAYNFATFAGEGGEYDDLLAYIREHRLR